MWFLLHLHPGAICTHICIYLPAAMKTLVWVYRKKKKNCCPDYTLFHDFVLDSFNAILIQALIYPVKYPKFHDLVQKVLRVNCKRIANCMCLSKRDTRKKYVRRRIQAKLLEMVRIFIKNWQHYTWTYFVPFLTTCFCGCRLKYWLFYHTLLGGWATLNC